MPFIIFSLAFILLLIIPGMIIAFSINDWHNRIDALSLIPESFIYSFAVGIAPGLYVLFSKKNLNTFAVLYISLVLLILLLSYRQVLKNVKTFVREMAVSRLRLSRFSIATMILGLLIMIGGTFLFRFGMGSDSWFTCASVRHFLISKEIHAHNQIFVDSFSILSMSQYEVYELFCALLSYISSAEVFTLVFLYVKIPLVILAALSTYSLAVEMFQDKRIASLSTLVLAFFCALSVYTQEGLGYVLFDRISQNKTIMAFIFIPIVLKYMYRFIGSGQRKDLFCFFVASVGAVILHPQGVIFIGFSCLSYLLFKSLFARHTLMIKRFGAMMIAIIVLVVFPFYQRLKFQDFPAELSKSSYSLKELKDLYLFRLPDNSMPCPLVIGGHTLPRVRYLTILKKGFYIVNPALVNHPFYLLTIIIVFWWLLDGRRRNKAEYQFLIGLTLTPLLAIFNPVTAPIFGYFTTAFKMWRMIWLIPVPLVIAQFIYEKSKRMPAAKSNRTNIIVILSVILAFSLGYEYIAYGKKPFHAIRNYLFMNSSYVGKGSYNERWTDIDEVVFHINDGGKTRWLLAPRHVNTRIPAYHGDIGILSFRGFPQTFPLLYQQYPDAVIEDRVDVVRDYSRGELSGRDLRRVVDSYGIDTIVIDKKFASKYLNLSKKLGFKKTFENKMFIIVKR